MKRIISSIVLLCFALCVSAQQQVLHSAYDVNGDGKVTLSDLTALIGKINGKTKDDVIHLTSVKIDTIHYQFHVTDTIHDTIHSIVYVTDTLPQPKTYTINGVEYPMPEAVDLGLPSGTLWANMNIGASNENDVGGFYGWADPTGELTFDDYPYMGTDNWQNVASYYPDYYWGVWTSPLFGGTNPPKDIQGTNLDIAKAKLGSKWVVPSSDDFQELSENCTFIEEEGRYKVVGGNGNYIYMINSGFYEFDVNKYGGIKPKGFGLNSMTWCPCFWASSRSDYNCYNDYDTQHNYPAADYSHCGTHGFCGADGTCDSWYRVGMIPIRACYKK